MLALSRIERASIPPREAENESESSGSALAEWANMCQPKAVSREVCSPIWSSFELMTFLARVSPKAGISAISAAIPSTLACRSSRGTTWLSIPQSRASAAVNLRPV